VVAQSTKSKASAVPVMLPDTLAAVLKNYRSTWTANADGWLFATRNDRPPWSKKVIEYRLWPILDGLDIPRCGLHVFRHSVASFIVDAGYSPEVAKQQLRHTDARTTLNHIHLRGGITEKAVVARR
jgi:integrase